MIEVAINIEQMLKECRKASKALASADESQLNNVLLTLADLLVENQQLILTENQKDMVKMDDSNPKKDRLMLNEARIKGLADSLHSIAKLPSPCNAVLMEQTMENGIKLQKIAVPMGVVGAIYESRPNVTIDIAALSLKSSNGCILRGGSDAYHSNVVLVSFVHEALVQHGFDPKVVCLFPIDRKYISELLTAVKYVDLIIPRGSQNLINFVRENSKIPTIETGAGVCHTYVAESADIDMAVDIVVNAKVTRPSVCNSLDTMVLHKSVLAEFISKVCPKLIEYNVEVFADERSYPYFSDQKYPLLQKAVEEDFGREFLSFKCSVKVVDGLDEALDHIEKYSSRHSEAIVSSDQKECDIFINSIDAAAVYSNASIRFTDGAEFGLGAEIGISTQKLHARGPFALEKLVTEKWIGRGSGQIR